MKISCYEEGPLLTDLDPNPPNLSKAAIGFSLEGFFTSWPVEKNWTHRLFRGRIKINGVEGYRS